MFHHIVCRWIALIIHVVHVYMVTSGNHSQVACWSLHQNIHRKPILTRKFYVADWSINQNLHIKSPVIPLQLTWKASHAEWPTPNSKCGQGFRANHLPSTVNLTIISGHSLFKKRPSNSSQSISDTNLFLAQTSKLICMSQHYHDDRGQLAIPISLICLTFKKMSFL